jgi:hypothetical protein
MAAATVAAAVAAAVVNAVAASEGAHHSVPPGALAAFLVAILVPAAVGLFVALRRPGNRVAWILLAGPLSVAIVMTGDAVSGLALHGNRESTLGAWAALVAGEWPVLFLWPLAMAYVFPDGRLPSRRWRPVAAAASAFSLGIVTLILIFPKLETS